MELVTASTRLPISSDELAGYPKRLTVTLGARFAIAVWEDLVNDVAGCIEAWATNRGEVDESVLVEHMREAIAYWESLQQNKAPAPVPIEARRSG